MERDGTNPDDPKLDTLSARFYFLARSPRYETEKPYTVRFDTEGKFPHTNIENVKHEVDVHDIRPLVTKDPNRFSLERQGFQLLTLPEKQRLSYEEFDDDAALRGKHIPHILTAVQSALKAGKIHVLDYRVRKRHVQFPVRADEDYKHLQPSARVHLDYTAAAIEKTVRDYCGADADAILSGRWQAINIWHPLRGPCIDWPLGVCDASTVDFKQDAMPSDFVDSWGYSENVQIHHSEGQRWYYLAGQMPHELWLFKSADSEAARGGEGAFPGTPHGAFENPHATSADLPRQSFEIRLLVTW